jgi:hypothetical protein
MGPRTAGERRTRTDKISSGLLAPLLYAAASAASTSFILDEAKSR